MGKGRLGEEEMKRDERWRCGTENGGRSRGERTCKEICKRKRRSAEYVVDKLAMKHRV